MVESESDTGGAELLAPVEEGGRGELGVGRELEGGGGEREE